MFEDSKTPAAAWKNTATLPEITVDPEKLAAAAETLRWARCCNRPLYNRYTHTKKKRTRKKYAKRILEWYRTEVA